MRELTLRSEGRTPACVVSSPRFSPKVANATRLLILTLPPVVALRVMMA